MLTEHNKHQKGRSKIMTVTFPNGTIFSSDPNNKDRDSKNQAEVWVKTIKKLIAKFGINQILEADRLTRRDHSQNRIISTDPTFRDTSVRKIRSTEHRENGRTYYITHDYRAERKKELLDSISDELNVGLIVDVP